jgi:tungstate transport system permease protein
MGFWSAFIDAFELIAVFDANLLEIIGLSLRVSLTSVLISLVVGLPAGAALATIRFRGRTAINVVVTSLMGLPPVVVGLCVYMMLSAAGPLGVLGLLYTPGAMIIAQTILIVPIVTALSRQTIADLNDEYADLFASLAIPPLQRILALLHDARLRLLTVALAGFGRAISEVGAVLIVGGNINHVTRVMTTAIALETSKGNLDLALALGAVLLTLALVVNALVFGLNHRIAIRGNG